MFVNNEAAAPGKPGGFYAASYCFFVTVAPYGEGVDTDIHFFDSKDEGVNGMYQAAAVYCNGLLAYDIEGNPVTDFEHVTIDDFSSQNIDEIKRKIDDDDDLYGIDIVPDEEVSIIDPDMYTYKYSLFDTNDPANR